MPQCEYFKLTTDHNKMTRLKAKATTRACPSCCLRNEGCSTAKPRGCLQKEVNELVAAHLTVGSMQPSQYKCHVMASPNTYMSAG